MHHGLLPTDLILDTRNMNTIKNLITVSNDGKQIRSTNYWATQMALEGFFYLTWNAGEARLLVPDSMTNGLDEMRSASHVIISQGPVKYSGYKARTGDGLELLFEDHSDEPFSLLIDETRQCDRRLPASDQGGGFHLSVWTPSGMAMRLPGFFRKVRSVPCLQPWAAR
ncbi:hypothetical protein GALL_465310 [mine drainage metagenome]|uniref:Uncharacterized protein n=1 Tax=mine drainage metagenome TaxID=410659 RepID=A0A1J5PL23_9ZZZZ